MTVIVVMRRVLLPLFLMICSIPLLATQGRPGVLRHRQPDGTVVEYIIRGDEFGHYIMTTDGCAVCLDENTGALCYAYYDWRGVKHNSRVAVGTSGESEVKRASRSIPFGAIGRQAVERRSAAGAMRVKALAMESGTSEHSAVVLLAQFSDLQFTHGRSDFVDMVCGTSYSAGGATGSVKEYFEAQFGDAGSFTFDVGPVVTLSHGYAYYGEDDEDGNDKRGAEAVAEACRLSDQAVDFSRYDCVFVYYAGGNTADGGADDDHIWPHSWDLPSAGIDLRLDGRQITLYGMTSELMHLDVSGKNVLASIGTFCHEYSHTLGLPDLYDTDLEKSGGESEALWFSTSLMDGGNYNNNGHTPPMFNAVELELLGLVEPEYIAVGQYELKPLTKERRCLRVDADVEDEYYLFECREESGWDRYIGGSGMLVYHVDRSARDAGYSAKFERNLTACERWSAEYNEINCRPAHQCADLVEASPTADDVSKVFFPYGPRISFSALSEPSFSFWSGESSPYSLSEIRRTGSSVAFTVTGPISIDSQDVFQDAAILNWHTDVPSCKSLPCKVIVTDASGDAGSLSVPPYEKGLYSYTMEGLTPGKSYSVTICYVSDGQDVFPCSFSFTTSQYGGLPYIYAGTSSRRNAVSTASNKLPLRVCNAKGAQSVYWTMDGREISVGRDGYWHYSRSGRLKAVVDYADGTQEIMVKDITVK